jgi:hypothetical protein
MPPKIGAITEQGDLGLGFDLLNEQDQNTYNEAVNNKRDVQHQIINEDKK